jgi:DNA-directed RNA polymerase specialized sigma24 family protein
MTGNGVARSAEWERFEANAAELRLLLERCLRRELVHDSRAAVARIQNLSVADLADEAIAWGLENWKAKPTATPPDLWIRKHALQLLDEALDAETLAAESRAEERSVERRLIAHDLVDDGDDEERADWLDMAQLAGRADRREKDGGEDEPFDGLESDPQVSSPQDRLDERETIEALERAMLHLPERTRRVVAHRFLDGLSVPEIAYLLEVRAETVESETVDGVSALRAELAAS